MNEDLIYLFTGDSEIFIKNKIARIIKKFRKFKTSTLKYDMEKYKLGDIIADLITTPFLEDFKIIILRNPHFLEGESLSFEESCFINYLKNPVETSLLLIDATRININQNNEIYKSLKNNAVISNFDNSEDIEIKGWIIRTLAVKEMEIKEDALNLFIEYLGSDQIRMEQEIEKLSTYKIKEKIISVEDVKILINKDLTNEIYLLITHILNNDFLTAHKQFQKINYNTKDSLSVISMINNSFNELLTTSKLLKKGYTQSDIATFYKISKGRAYYIIKNAKAFEQHVLEKYVKKLSLLDYQIKSGNINKDLAIDLLLLNNN